MTLMLVVGAVVVVVLVVVLLQGARRALLDNAAGVNDYFSNAVMVFGATGDETVHAAALAAGKTAASSSERPW